MSGHSQTGLPYSCQPLAIPRASHKHFLVRPQVRRLPKHLHHRMMLQHVDGFIRPIVPREMNIRVHPRHILRFRRQPLHTQVQQPFLVPQLLARAHLQVHRIVPARHFIPPVPERRLHHKQLRPAGSDISFELLEQPYPALEPARIENARHHIQFIIPLLVIPPTCAASRWSQ